MRIVRRGIVLAVGLVLVGALTARAETAAEAFARGNTLLADGEFQQSLKAYSAAARADRSNRQYAQQFMLVRRVITLRSHLDREKDPRRWLATAQSLRSFYVDRKLMAEALRIDERIHAKQDTALSAGQLAETQMALGNNADATRVLTSSIARSSSASLRPAMRCSIVRRA